MRGSARLHCFLPPRLCTWAQRERGAGAVPCTVPVGLASAADTFWAWHPFNGYTYSSVIVSIVASIDLLRHCESGGEELLRDLEEERLCVGMNSYASYKVNINKIPNIYRLTKSKAALADPSRAQIGSPRQFAHAAAAGCPRGTAHWRVGDAS